MKVRNKLFRFMLMTWGTITLVSPSTVIAQKKSDSVLCSPISGALRDFVKVCTDTSDGAYSSDSAGVLIFIRKDAHLCSLSVTNINLDPWHLDETSGIAQGDLKAAQGDIFRVNFKYSPNGWGYDLFGIVFSAESHAETFVREVIANLSGIKQCDTIQDAGLK